MQYPHAGVPCRVAALISIRHDAPSAHWLSISAVPRSRLRHSEPRGGFILGKQSSDPRILELGRCLAATANEEKAIVVTHGLDTKDVSIQAFDPGNETLHHQEVKCPVDGRGSGQMRISELDRFIGAEPGSG